MKYHSIAHSHLSLIVICFSLHSKLANTFFKLLVCSMAVHYQRTLKSKCENTQYGFCIYYCSLICQIYIKLSFSGCSYKFFYIIWICKTNFYFLHTLISPFCPVFILSIFSFFKQKQNKNKFYS